VVIKFIAMFLVGILFISGYVVQHETTHKQIYHLFGCDSEITFKGITPVTIPDVDCNITPELLLAQSNAESFGYHLAPVYILLVLLFLVIVDLRN